jgi:chaperone modulatory protein CbpM
MRAIELIEANRPMTEEDLEVWIREELIVAVREERGLVFTDRECARVRLIRTLRYELDVEIDTLPVIMSLLDQLYETRAQLRALGAAIAAQDKATREAILGRLVTAERD